MLATLSPDDIQYIRAITADPGLILHRAKGRSGVAARQCTTRVNSKYRTAIKIALVRSITAIEIAFCRACAPPTRRWCWFGRVRRALRVRREGQLKNGARAARTFDNGVGIPGSIRRSSKSKGGGKLEIFRRERSIRFLGIRNGFLGNRRKPEIS
jgi:hypothetical protein